MKIGDEIGPGDLRSLKLLSYTAGVRTTWLLLLVSCTTQNIYLLTSSCKCWVAVGIWNCIYDGTVRGDGRFLTSELAFTAGVSTTGLSSIVSCTTQYRHLLTSSLKCRVAARIWSYIYDGTVRGDGAFLDPGARQVTLTSITRPADLAV